MIHDPQPTLTSLQVLPPQGLRLTFADGATLTVDLAETLRSYPALAAPDDPELFSAARLDARGGCTAYLVTARDCIRARVGRTSCPECPGGARTAAGQHGSE